MSQKQEESGQTDKPKNETNDNHATAEGSPDGEQIPKEIKDLDENFANIRIDTDITAKAMDSYEQFQLDSTAHNEYDTMKETFIMLLNSQVVNTDDIYEDVKELIELLQRDQPPEDPTDTLLQIFSNMEPFNFFTTLIREYNGFGIYSDEKCIEVLKELQQELHGKVADDFFPNLIKFVDSVDNILVPGEIYEISSIYDLLEGYKFTSKMLECNEYMRNLIEDDE